MYLSISFTVHTQVIQVVFFSVVVCDMIFVCVQIFFVYIYPVTPVLSDLTLRRLMSYIYIYMEHPFLMFLDHTQRRSTVGRTPLDE